MKLLYSPQTRWLECARAARRYIEMWPAIYETYDELSKARGGIGGSTAKGRLKAVQSVYTLFCTHLLVDSLLPMAKCSMRNQDPNSLACEIAENLEQLRHALVAIKANIFILRAGISAVHALLAQILRKGIHKNRIFLRRRSFN